MGDFICKEISWKEWYVGDETLGARLLNMPIENIMTMDIDEEEPSKTKKQVSELKQKINMEWNKKNINYIEEAQKAQKMVLVEERKQGLNRLLQPNIENTTCQ